MPFWESIRGFFAVSNGSTAKRSAAGSNGSGSMGRNPKGTRSAVYYTVPDSVPNSHLMTLEVNTIPQVLDRSNDNRWKGLTFSPKFQSRSGYFPPSAVHLIDRHVGMQRSVSHRQVKKVGVPQVPAGAPPPSPLPPAKVSTRQHTTSTATTSNYGSLDGLCSPLHQFAKQQQNINNGNVQDPQLSNGHTNQKPSGALRTFQSPNHAPRIPNGNHAPCSSSSNHSASPDSGVTCGPMSNAPAAHGGTAAASPRHRNSTGSNSSQGSSGFESMKSVSQPHVNVTVHTLRGDSPPSRNSVHSSSSGSLGSSLERLDESGYASQVNINELIMNGVPDVEVLSAWLHDLRHEEYLSLFLNAGYDLCTVARMTPEDLTAIGITKPGHRKRLTTEIHRLNVGDPLPCREPAGGLRGWLQALNLLEYLPLFESQGYTTVKQVSQLCWEDWEDVGIKKLGHLKKLGLAVKKLKDGRAAAAGRDHQHAQGVVDAEVLVINPGPHRGPTAEVRPYSHLPPQHMSQRHRSAVAQPQCSPRARSPQTMTMSTFHQPPEASAVNNGHQYNGGGYDTFPRRSVSYAGVGVHQQPTDLQAHPMVGSPLPQRPTGTVKPVAHIQGAKSKRASVEVPPPSCSTDSRGQYGEDEIDMLKRQNIYRNGSVHNGGPYANVRVGGEQTVCEKTDSFSFATTSNGMDDASHYANFQPLNGAFVHQETYAANGQCRVVESGVCAGMVSPRLQLNPLSPRRAVSPLKKPPPPPPPKRAVSGPSSSLDHQDQLPPPPKPPVFVRGGPHLSAALLNESADSLPGISPAPSLDELPPPPEPPSIRCEESIRHLRTIMTSDGGPTGTSASSGSGDRSDSASCSSSDAIPFANENCGTIRVRNSHQQNQANGVAERPDLTEMFGPHSDDDFPPPPPMLSAQKLARQQSPVSDLNDIGNMLQNLTDELDALISDPKNGRRGPNPS